MKRIRVRRRRGRSRSRRRSFAGFSGFDGLEKSFMADIGGVIAHCKRYGKGPSGKIRCMTFGKGGGRPRGRKSAGITSRWRETSKIRRKRRARRAHAKGAKRVCIRFKHYANGRKRCMSFAPVGKGRRFAYKRPKTRRICAKFGKSGGKRVCRRWRVARKSRRRSKMNIVRRTSSGPVGIHSGMSGLSAYRPKRRRKRRGTRSRTRRRSRRRG